MSYKLYASDKRTLIEPRVQGYSCDAMRSVVDLTIDPSDKKYTAFLSRCVPFIFRGVQRLVLSGERSILSIMEDVRLMRVMRALPLGIDVQINNFDRQGSVDMGAKGRYDALPDCVHSVCNRLLIVICRLQGLRPTPPQRAGSGVRVFHQGFPIRDA